SASQVVHQARSPQAAALDLLRPLPRQPSAAAARGTAFHAWLESRYDSAALLDLEDLLDLDDADGAEAALEDRALREAFTASEWADRSPIAVEQPVHTRVGEIAVRGVIDAVFADPEGSDGSEGVIIVDWKTGRVPRPAQLRQRALQLSLYRLAWHERTGLPLSRIRTAFHFVADAVTHEVRRHPSRERTAQQLAGEWARIRRALPRASAPPRRCARPPRARAGRDPHRDRRPCRGRRRRCSRHRPPDRGRDIPPRRARRAPAPAPSAADGSR